MDGGNYTVSNIALIVTAIIVITVYVTDVYILLYGQGQNTISQEIRMASQRYPILPFLIGVLVGHILWPIM